MTKSVLFLLHILNVSNTLPGFFYDHILGSLLHLDCCTAPMEQFHIQKCLGKGMGSILRRRLSEEPESFEKDRSPALHSFPGLWLQNQSNGTSKVSSCIDESFVLFYMG